MDQIKQYKYIENKNSDKLHQDKYYTSDEVAQYCINVGRKILKGEKITEVIDPSAGTGVFSKKIKNCVAYDIEPEDKSIIRQDFLELDIPYKQGRLFITNPPFGSKMVLVKKFFKKCVSLGDYIIFILPISQLNNKYSDMCQFDLIHSEDLGEQNYSGRKIHCCLNIYRRPSNGVLHQKEIARLKDITILRDKRKGFNEAKDWDIRMCYWGNGSAGKILKDDENYSGEFKIIIHKQELKDKILSALQKADWHKELPHVSMLKIQKYHLIEFLKREVPEIR